MESVEVLDIPGGNGASASQRDSRNHRVPNLNRLSVLPTSRGQLSCLLSGDCVERQNPPIEILFDGLLESVLQPGSFAAIRENLKTEVDFVDGNRGGPDRLRGSVSSQTTTVGSGCTVWIRLGHWPGQVNTWTVLLLHPRENFPRSELGGMAAKGRQC